MQAEADEAGRTLDLTPPAVLLSDLIVHDDVVGHIDLRADGYRTALVTNNVREGAAAWRAMIPVDDLFDVVVDSSSVGMRKPNPAIFTLDLLGGVAPGRRCSSTTSRATWRAPGWRGSTHPGGRPARAGPRRARPPAGPRRRGRGRRAEPRRDGPHRETLRRPGPDPARGGLSRTSCPKPPSRCRCPRRRGEAPPAGGRRRPGRSAFFFGTTFVVCAGRRRDGRPAALHRRAVPHRRRRPVAGGPAPRADPLERRHGVAAGSALLAGYVLQTVGLQYTSPSTSAFITYLLVVFVPLLSLAVLRRRPTP